MGMRLLPFWIKELGGCVGSPGVKDVVKMQEDECFNK